MSELKPCPFCGSEDAEMEANCNKRGQWFVYVRCELCRASSRTFTNKSEERPDCEAFWNDVSVRKAMNAWNTRSGEE